MKNDQFIILERADLEAVFEELIDKIRPNQPVRFITEDEARKLLNCGKTQLYHLRTNGKIAYVQDEEHPKMILYDRNSIDHYLQNNLKKPF